MAESDVWLASEVVVLSQYLVDVENEGSPLSALVSLVSLTFDDTLMMFMTDTSSILPPSRVDRHKEQRSKHP